MKYNRIFNYFFRVFLNLKCDFFRLREYQSEILLMKMFIFVWVMYWVFFDFCFFQINDI